MTYTFDLNKKNNKNTFNTPSNASSYIDNLISLNLKKTMPYIFGDTGFDENEDIIIIPKSTSKKTKKTIDIDITIPGKSSKKPTYAEFTKAFLHLLNTSDYADTFDFKLDDGTPIKLFDDEIQIGYELIPLNEGTKKIYDILSANRAKEIIDIYINISK